MTTARQMYESLRNEPNADEMDFIVQRPPEKRRVGETISAEALDEFQTAVNTFIAARMEYHWKQREGGMKAMGPSVIKAEVRITIDDVHIEPHPDQRPWFVIDGQKRPT